MASNLNIGNELNSAMRAASRGVVGIQYDEKMDARFTVNGQVSPAVERLGNEIGSYTQTLQALGSAGAAVSTSSLKHAEELDNGFRDEGIDAIQPTLNPQMQREAGVGSVWRPISPKLTSFSGVSGHLRPAWR